MENGLVNMANELVSRGVKTHVACLRDRGAFADRLPDPTQITLLKKGTGFSLASAFALRNTLRTVRPALVHTHNLGPLIYSALATIGGQSVPILHGEHGQIQTQDLTAKRLATRRLLYRCCHTVHTVSGSLLEGLRNMNLGSKRMAAITNGVDCVRYAPPVEKAAAKTALGIPAAGTLVLGIVGRFVALKRHMMLLSALESSMVAHSNVHLLVVGDHGSEREQIVNAMQAHPCADRIHWLGMRSDMANCYQAMDLLVSPSEVEGLSNAVLEAMACGVPVLAHKACGNNEAVINGDGGYLVELTDARALDEAIRSVITQPAALAAQGERARARVQAQFSLQSMADGYLRLYKEVAGLG